jgi:putative endonuclease
VVDRSYFVYILASPTRTLYIGVTGDLARRVAQHGAGCISSFTRKYGVLRLVHAERFEQAREAVGREKQLKGWNRERKVALIEASNPLWKEIASS